MESYRKAFIRFSGETAGKSRKQQIKAIIRGLAKQGIIKPKEQSESVFLKLNRQLIWECAQKAPPRIVKNTITPINKSISTDKIKSTIKPSKKNIDVCSTAFLESFEWRKLRMVALTKYGNVCQCCGMSPKDGIVIHVDHIKPRKTHPELALDINNLQILCESCNHGKSNWDSTDWR
jgi:5-methylcytosine-specific restriction endonuclease McrA